MPAPTPMPASVALSKDRLARGQVLQAQIDVSVSRAQSLVSSWLPARTAAPVDDEYSDNDDDEAVFKPAPPRLGLGAAVPSNYTEKARDDSLRRNMLGRKPTKALPETAKKRLTAADESDEDTGRSAVGSKRKRPVNNDLRKQKVHKASVVALAPKPAQTEQAAETAPVVKPVPSGSPKPVAAAGGPLSPSKKKKKKKNKKNKKSQPSE